MSFADVVRFMEQSWLGVAGRDLFWVFPLAEILHFFGLCLLMGAIIILDLRLLGFGAKRVSLQGALALAPAAIAGLIINTLTGIVFLCTSPENYWPSTAFRIKLGVIVFGAVNALWFKWIEEPRLKVLAAEARVGTRIQIIAALSLFTWTVVIVIGRFLPYVSKSTS